MNQSEAVIEVMRAHGGYATLGYLYEHALKLPSVEWKTKTPFASIRRIVREKRFFFKIRPGLWALKEFRNKIPFAEFAHPKAAPEETQKFNHSYYQGLVVQIGNLRRFETFVPTQDKNKLFLNKPLSQVVSLKSYYQFTYDSIVRRAQTIDVTWFNERKLPDSFIEVEHSTDMQNSLLKFFELQDFHSSFFIVAPASRKGEFGSKIFLQAFRPIKERVRLWTYENVSDLHAHLSELAVIERRMSQS
jgi:hypothetical protein